MTGTIGFIGLGIMGLPMAANLVKKSGRVVYGFDVVQERCDLFQQAGVRLPVSLSRSMPAVMLFFSACPPMSW